MEQFRDVRVSQKPLDIGRARLPRRDLNNVCRSIACRKLDHAQAVAVRHEAERFRVDRRAGAETRVIRQVSPVQTYSHRAGRPDAPAGRLRIVKN
jgi:hypothetical protein